MNYTKKSFTVAAPNTDAYRDNYERIFRGKKPAHVHTLIVMANAQALGRGYETAWRVACTACSYRSKLMTEEQAKAATK